MKMATHLLMETTKSIKEIAKEVGYESQSKFSKAFKRKITMFSPDSIEYSIQTN